MQIMNLDEQNALMQQQHMIALLVHLLALQKHWLRQGGQQGQVPDEYWSGCAQIVRKPCNNNSKNYSNIINNNSHNKQTCAWMQCVWSWLPASWHAPGARCCQPAKTPRRLGDRWLRPAVVCNHIMYIFFLPKHKIKALKSRPHKLRVSCGIFF